MIYPSLVFSISMTFSVKNKLTLIFILPWFSSFLSFIIVATGKMIFHLGCGRLAIVVSISDWIVDFFDWKLIPTKKQKPIKDAPDFRSNSYFLRE